MFHEPLLIFPFYFCWADGITGRSPSRRLTTFWWQVPSNSFFDLIGLLFILRISSIKSKLVLPLFSLLVGQVCSFLVRPSDNTPGDYSLFFRTNENIQRFKISPTPNNQYMMGGRYYNRYDQLYNNTAKRLSWWTVSLTLPLSRQCWWHHRPLQKRADCRGLQPERAGLRAGRPSPPSSSLFIWVTHRCIHFLFSFWSFCSIRNKFSPTRWTAEKFITLSGGNQKTLSTKTLSRKATSSSTKVKHVASSLVSDWPGSILILFFFFFSQHQAKASGGKTSTSSWREPTPSSSTSRAKREQPNPKGWSIWACAPCTACTTVCLAGGRPLLF